MRVSKLFVLTISVAAMVAASQDTFAQKAMECVPLKDTEKTSIGYFATIVFREKKPRRSIHGVARFRGIDGDPLESVYVEVFEQGKSDHSQRVAGCRTGLNGKFEFNGIPAGKYLVRLSKNGGYQITNILLSISPRSNHTKEIPAFMEVGY